MLFNRSKQKPITSQIAKEKLVLTLPKRSKFLFFFKIFLVLSAIGAGFYMVFYYRYDSDFNLVVNEVCSPFETYKLETITELQTSLSQMQLSYQVESFTRSKLEQEIKILTSQLKEAQIELDFLRGNNPNNQTN